MTNKGKSNDPFQGELFQVYEEAFNYFLKTSKELVKLLESSTPAEFDTIVKKIKENNAKAEAFAKSRRKVLIENKKK